MPGIGDFLSDPMALFKALVNSTGVVNGGNANPKGGQSQTPQPPSNLPSPGVSQAGGVPAMSIIQDDNTGAVVPQQPATSPIAPTHPQSPAMGGVSDKLIGLALPALLGLGAEMQQPRGAGMWHRIGAGLTGAIPAYLQIQHQQNEDALRRQQLEQELAIQEGRLSLEQEKIKEVPPDAFEPLRAKFPQIPNKTILADMSGPARSDLLREYARASVTGDKPKFTIQKIKQPDGSVHVMQFDEAGHESPKDLGLAATKEESKLAGAETVTIYGPNGEAKKVVWNKADGEYTPPAGWSLDKQAKGKKLSPSALEGIASKAVTDASNVVTEGGILGTTYGADPKARQTEARNNFVAALEQQGYNSDEAEKLADTYVNKKYEAKEASAEATSTPTASKDEFLKKYGIGPSTSIVPTTSDKRGPTILPPPPTTPES